MSVVASFSLGSSEFPLGRALSVAEGSVRLETVVPTSRSAVPYLWAPRTHVAQLERHLIEDPLVEAATTVDRVDDEALVRVEWSEDINGLIDAILDIEAVVLEAIGNNDRWVLRLRFTAYEDLSSFYHDCVDRGIDVQLERIHDPGEGRPAYELTDEQRRALEAALRGGYFSIPREVSLDELGEQLGISDSAVSQRIRRGLERLLTTTLDGESSHIHPNQRE